MIRLTLSERWSHGLQIRVNEIKHFMLHNQIAQKYLVPVAPIIKNDFWLLFTFCKSNSDLLDMVIAVGRE
jgi:hypothetical protein